MAAAAIFVCSESQSMVDHFTVMPDEALNAARDALGGGAPKRATVIVTPFVSSELAPPALQPARSRVNAETPASRAAPFVLFGTENIAYLSTVGPGRADFVETVAPRRDRCTMCAKRAERSGTDPAILGESRRPRNGSCAFAQFPCARQ